MMWFVVIATVAGFILGWIACEEVNNGGDMR